MGSLRPAYLLLVLSLVVSGPSAAATIAWESFDYAPGELDGQSGGGGFAGAWSADTGITEVADPGAALAFSSGSIGVDGGASALRITGNDNNIAFRDLAAPVSADEIFVSFLFRYDGALDDNDFAVLWHDDAATGSHTSRPNLGIKANHGDGSGTEDVVARLQLSGSGQVYGVDLLAGQTYFILGRLHKSAPGAGNDYDRLDLWVDPTDGASGTPDLTASGAGAISSFDTIGIRSVNIDGPDTFWIDEIRYTTSFADSTAATVPEPALAWLVSAALLGVSLRRS